MSKIKIDFNEQDLQDLLNGRNFDWTFLDENQNNIEVHLYNSDLESEG